MKKLLLTLLLLLPLAAEARNVDLPVRFTQECATVDGDDLDLNDDGICELLDGFRLYNAAGEFVYGLAEDGTREFTHRMNLGFARHCFYMTSHLTANGQAFESDPSNQTCIDVFPGKPVPPVIF